MESNEELLARHVHVLAVHGQAKKKMECMKLGSASRDRQARFVGSLYFTILGIRSEMDRRHLKLPCT